MADKIIKIISRNRLKGNGVFLFSVNDGVFDVEFQICVFCIPRIISPFIRSLNPQSWRSGTLIPIIGQCTMSKISLAAAKYG